MKNQKFDIRNWREARILPILLVFFFALAPARLSAEKINTAYTSISPGASTVMWIAKEARLFDKHGLEATVIFVSGSIRGIQAILAGETPIGEGAGPGLTSARLAGADIVAIAGSLNVLPYYLVVHPSIKRIEDLKGKTGGNHLAGTVADFALQASLKKLGLQPGKDLSLRVIGGGNERMVALQKNIVQFTVATEPGRVMAEKLGFPVLLDMAKLQLPFPQNGIYTSTKLIRENPDMVRKYLKAYVEAIHYFKSRKEETIKIMSKYSRLENRKLLEDTWEWYILYLPEAPYPPVDGYRLILDEQATTNTKAAQANAKDFVDLRFIKELEDSGFIKSLYGK